MPRAKNQLGKATSFSSNFLRWISIPPPAAISRLTPLLAVSSAYSTDSRPPERGNDPHRLSLQNRSIPFFLSPGDSRSAIAAKTVGLDLSAGVPDARRDLSFSRGWSKNRLVIEIASTRAALPIDERGWTGFQRATDGRC